MYGAAILLRGRVVSAVLIHIKIYLLAHNTKRTTVSASDGAV